MWNIAIGVVIVAALTCVICFDLGESSPGALSAVHSNVAALRGAAGCAVCHGGEGQTLADACQKCHEDVAGQLDTRTCLHGGLDPAQVVNCGRCHMEHRGPDFDPAGDRAFVAAGFEAGLSGFKHQGFEFGLTGRHDALACEKCHRHADDAVLAEGCKRFLGLSQDCVRCHDDPHDGELQDCASCHGQSRPFDEAALFEHDPRVPLVGAHANLACKKCHEPKSEFSIETDGSRRATGTRVEVRSCEACHDSAHSAPFLQGVARVVAVPAAQACETCHDPRHKDFYTGDVEAGRRLHASTGLRLVAPHDRLECRSCHDGIGAKPPGEVSAAVEHGRRFPGRDTSKCTSCHESSHSGAFLGEVAEIAKAESGETCALCHGGEHRDFRTIDVAANRRLHIASGFDLVAPHDRLDCRTCHDGIGAEPSAGVSAETEHDRRFPVRDTSRCASCHESSHSGAFLGRVAEIAKPASGETCTLCHGGEHRSFRTIDIVANRRLHIASGFDLVAPHDRADCRTCHAGIGSGHADAKRFPGRAPQRCASCHEDPHGGQFAGGTFAAANCTDCHAALTFRPAAFTARHHSKTRFPLTGAHQAVGCSVCHKSEPPDSHPVFGAAPIECAKCHVDVHGGDFEWRLQGQPKRDANGCAICHNTESFCLQKGQSFDHAKWTGFRLEGRHAGAACVKCHPATSPTHAGTRRFAKASPRCSDCHADTHAGQFAVRGRTDCGRCHSSKAGFDSLLFDHRKDSRFKLDSEHEKLACAKCHQTYALPKGGKVIRYKPLGTKCVDCHGWRSAKDYEAQRRRQKR